MCNLLPQLLQTRKESDCKASEKSWRADCLQNRKGAYLVSEKEGRVIQGYQKRKEACSCLQKEVCARLGLDQEGEARGFECRRKVVRRLSRYWQYMLSKLPI